MDTPAELYARAREFSERAERLFAERDALRARVRELRAAYQPEIDTLKAQADASAQRFRYLYQEAQAAYDGNNKALAKALAAQGKTLQAECQARNDAVSRAIAGLDQRTRSLHDAAATKHRDAIASIAEAKRLRGLAHDAAAPSRHKGDPRTSHIPRHVGKDFDELVDRLRSDPRLRFASSFPDQATAGKAISAALQENDARIRAWLTTTKDRLVLHSNLPTIVGFTATRVPSAHTESHVVVILDRDKNARAGYRVFDAYTDPERQRR